MSAYLFLANKRQDRESHRLLSLIALGANPGDGKELKKQFETWEKDA